MEETTSKYLTDRIDPAFIRASRDVLLEYLKGPHVLNLGIGYGTWEEALSKSDLAVTSIDIDANLIGIYRELYPAIEFVHSDILRYKSEKKYDTIIASHFIEHFESPTILLKKLKELLSEDGRIIIVVPNANSVHRRIGVEMGLLKETSELNASDKFFGHYQVFNRRALIDLAKAEDLYPEEFGGVSFKALSNTQLSQLPQDYVEASARLRIKGSAGDLCAQLYLIAKNRTLSSNT